MAETNLGPFVALDQLGRFKDKADQLYETKEEAASTYATKSELESMESETETLFATKAEVEALKLTDLANDGNFVQDASYVHTDSNYTAAEKAKVANLDADADATYATKSEVGALKGSDIANDLDWQTGSEVSASISSAIVGLLDYKGSVATYSDLPSSGVEKGDVYNVQAEYQNTPAGTNYAWNGSSWDPLGGEIDLSGYAEKSDLPTKLTDLTNNGNFVQDAAYVHTDSNYTAVEKSKVANLASNANGTYATKTELSQSESTAASTYATKNEVGALKLTDLQNDGNFVQDASYVHTDSNYTAAEKSKLSGIEDQANKYVLPVTTPSTLGGMKVGDGLEAASDGTVSMGGTVKSGNPVMGTKLTFVTGNGWSAQNQTSGKNLAAPVTSASGNCSVTEDGLCTISGSKTNAGLGTAFETSTLEPGTYTVRHYAESPLSSGVGIQVRNGDQTILINDVSGGTVTLTSATQLIVRVYMPSGTLSGSFRRSTSHTPEPSPARTRITRRRSR